jgi:RimJ/RimL family protein N-acetyltransferase
VTLRPWTFDDVPAIAAACADAEIARWLDLIPQPYTDRDAREYVASSRQGWQHGESSNFAVRDAERDDVLGAIGIRWIDRRNGVGEAGYWVAPAARGRGVATRALCLVARWALTDVAARRLQLRADELNEPSKRVAENAGFRREGVLRSSHYNARQNRSVDFVMYSLLPDDLVPLGSEAAQGRHAPGTNPAA